MTIVDKTRSNGLKQQEDWSNVIGTCLISRNGLKMNWVVWGSLRFCKNIGQHLPVSITDVPYGRGIALAETAKCLLDIRICSAPNWTHLSRLVPSSSYCPVWWWHSEMGPWLPSSAILMMEIHRGRHWGGQQRGVWCVLSGIIQWNCLLHSKPNNTLRQWALTQLGLCHALLWKSSFSA